MTEKIYKKLARHLDELPAGYPTTESGVELRILKRLFTTQEAELATHVNLIPETAKVIARRAGIKNSEADQRLEEMAQKGLIFSIDLPKKPVLYMAAQLAVGIWEYQVDNLDKDLIRDMNEYLPTFLDLDIWKRAPQLRTVPIGKSIDASMNVMSYETAESMVRAQSRIRLLPCICRREHTMVGEGCERPEESCLVFGTGAYYYAKRGIGRDIDMDECLEVLKRADKAGLVLQPNNAKKLTNLCSCCGCCCQILINLGRHPKPAEIVSSPFIAAYESETCKVCGVCENRCQMGAISMEEENIALNLARCIGCGLCVTTCPTKSLTLVRKSEEEQSYIPADTMESHISLARARGKMGKGTMLKMSLRSKWDRWLAK